MRFFYISCILKRGRRGIKFYFLLLNRTRRLFLDLIFEKNILNFRETNIWKKKWSPRIEDIIPILSLSPSIFQILQFWRNNPSKSDFYDLRAYFGICIYVQKFLPIGKNLVHQKKLGIFLFSRKILLVNFQYLKSYGN